MSERMTPSIRVDHARQYIEVTDLLNQNAVDAAWAKFQQYHGSLAMMGGAIDVSLPEHQPPPSVSTFPAGPGTTEFQRIGIIAPGAVYSVALTSRSRCDMSPSSGSGECWISANPGFPNDPALTKYAIGTTESLVTEGTVYVKIGGGFNGPSPVIVNTMPVA